MYFYICFVGDISLVCLEQLDYIDISKVLSIEELESKIADIKDRFIAYSFTHSGKYKLITTNNKLKKGAIKDENS